MKKIFSLFFIAMATIAFYASCSDDSSSSADGESQDFQSSLMRTESSSVIVYTYEEFSKGNEVKVLDSDTSKISINCEFAGKADSVVPRPGDIIVIWNDIKNEPFYLQVASIVDNDSVYTLTVDKASPFDAIPAGDYELSSEIYADSNAVTNDGRLSYEAFYNKETKTYHPFLIKEEPELQQNADGLLVGKDLSEETPFSKALKDKHYVDLRDAKLQSGSEDWTVIDINAEFHPGIIGIPGMGKIIGDYQGSWLDAFGGLEKLEKAMDKNGEKNPDDSSIRAYLRMDTLKFKSKVDFHLSWSTSWLSVNGFDFYAKASQDVYVSDFGLGLGAGFSGDKKLTEFEGKGFMFSIFGIPIYIKITPNLFFKYEMEAYAVLDYRLNYTKHSEGRAGLSWKSGNGVSVIKDGKTESSYNKSENLEEFVNNSQMVFCGNASSGIYLRISALLYNVIGPTAGVGFRVDLNSKVGTATSFDDEGNWTGNFHAADDAYVKLDGAFAVEAGAEVSILGHTLFSKSYDVYDIMQFPFFHLPEGKDDSSDEGNIPTSSSFKPLPLLSSSSRGGPPKPVPNPCSVDPSFCEQN